VARAAAPTFDADDKQTITANSTDLRTLQAIRWFSGVGKLASPQLRND
jgi:hypothetical protein